MVSNGVLVFSKVVSHGLLWNLMASYCVLWCLTVSCGRAIVVEDKGKKTVNGSRLPKRTVCSKFTKTKSFISLDSDLLTLKIQGSVPP